MEKFRNLCKLVIDMFRLFVYGTLKRGFSNYHFLTNSRFLGKAETVDKYGLYFKDYYPFAKENKKISTIKGEIYLVSKSALQQIDALEEVPNYYYRKLIRAKLIDTTKIVHAFIYFNNFEKGFLIKSGIFLINKFCKEE